MTKSIDLLRSQRWFAPDNMRAFAHRQRTQQTGRKRADFEGRPVIVIINTWSDISTCHVHLRERPIMSKKALSVRVDTRLRCRLCRWVKSW